MRVRSGHAGLGGAAPKPPEYFGNDESGVRGGWRVGRRGLTMLYALQSRPGLKGYYAGTRKTSARVPSLNRIILYRTTRRWFEEIDVSRMDAPRRYHVWDNGTVRSF